MVNVRGVPLVLVVASLFLWMPVTVARSAFGEDETVTEDPALNRQIVKVSHELERVNLEMAQHERALQGTTEAAQRTALSSELDRLREARSTLRQLIDRLVEAGKAGEETAIDEALQRARKLERLQERASDREETLYDRRTR